MATASAKLGVTLIMDDRTVTIFEGDTVTDLVYNAGNTQRTLSGKVRVIHATTRANSTVPDDCPPEPYAQRYITPYAISLDSSNVFDAEMTQINISNIVSVGTVNESNRGAEINGIYYDSYVDALAAAKEGDTIVMGTDEAVAAPINTVPSGVTIDGNDRTISFTAGEELANSGIFEFASVKNIALKDITLEPGAGIKFGVNTWKTENCVLENVTINGGAYCCVEVNGTDVTMRNCVLNPSDVAYCNIEWGIGSGVEVIPKLILENVQGKDGIPMVYMDMTTVDRLKALVPELAEAEPIDVVNYVNANYVKGAKIDLPGVTYSVTA